MFMKISELIAQLEAIKEKEGDLLTAAYCGISEDGEMVKKVIVETRGEKQALYYQGDNLFRMYAENEIGKKVVVIVSR